MKFSAQTELRVQYNLCTFDLGVESRSSMLEVQLISVLCRWVASFLVAC